jgi:hypothetical protein
VKKKEKYKEGKVIACYVFQDSSVGIFLPRKSCYGSKLFTLSIVKILGDVAMLI